MAKLESVETSVGSGETKRSYTVDVLQFESLDDYAKHLPEGKDANEAILQILNAANEQNAKQGMKEGVRSAMNDPEKGDEEVEKAIADHQAWAPEYVVAGATRGRIAGVTKTAAGEVGKKLLEADPEQLKALAEQLGVEL
ncbi:MAG: hypothetical protein GY906_37225 [bacterium]|nr:hypothetical protein [bacterium]